MKLYSLEMDYASQAVGSYFEKILQKDIQRIKGSPRDEPFHSKWDIGSLMRRSFKNSKEKKLVLYGSGSLHHYTYGLCRLADKLSKNYAYIHFDHHDDFVPDITSKAHGRLFC